MHKMFLIVFALVVCHSVLESSAAEAARIPIIHEVDIAVVGGSGGAVAAAVEAARTGASVCLLARRPYVGDDFAGALRLWDDEGKRLTIKDIVLETVEPGDYFKHALGVPLTPLNVKKYFDKALHEAGVLYMTGCYSSGILQDASGRIGGIVIVNRSGRQVIKAKVVIDATPFGHIARLAGAQFSPFKPGNMRVNHVVVSETAPVADGLEVQAFADEQEVVIGGRWGVKPLHGSDKRTVRCYECSASIPLHDVEPLSLAALEQEMRDRTFTYGQQDAGERIWFVTPFHIKGVKTVAQWERGDDFPLKALCPRGVKRLYVLSGVADVSPSVAAELTKPLNLMRLVAVPESRLLRMQKG